MSAPPQTEGDLLYAGNQTSGQRLFFGQHISGEIHFHTGSVRQTRSPNRNSVLLPLDE